MPSAPGGAARDALSVPSILILVLGALGGALFLVSLISDATGLSLKLAHQLLPFLPGELQEMFRERLAEAATRSRAGTIVFDVFCIGCAGFVVYGALQMRALKNWGVALAAVIVAMIPCGSHCCCCLGLPLGIWVLIVLTKPEVKSAFS